MSEDYEDEETVDMTAEDNFVDPCDFRCNECLRELCVHGYCFTCVGCAECDLEAARGYS